MESSLLENTIPNHTSSPFWNRYSTQPTLYGKGVIAQASTHASRKKSSSPETDSHLGGKSALSCPPWCPTITCPHQTAPAPFSDNDPSHLLKRLSWRPKWEATAGSEKPIWPLQASPQPRGVCEAVIHPHSESVKHAWEKLQVPLVWSESIDVSHLFVLQFFIFISDDHMGVCVASSLLWLKPGWQHARLYHYCLWF